MSVNLKKLRGAAIAAFACAAAACTTTGPTTVRSVDLNTQTCEVNMVERTGNNVKVMPGGQDAQCAAQKLQEAQRSVEEERYGVTIQLMEEAWSLSTPAERLRDLNPYIILWAQHDDPVLSTSFSEFAERHGIEVTVAESNCVEVEGRGLLCGDSADEAVSHRTQRQNSPSGMRPGV
tara:strand:- start:30 stop:560 length:531 start_codon:yes stop_codon:yes gene_type:complete